MSLSARSFSGPTTAFCRMARNSGSRHIARRRYADPPTSFSASTRPLSRPPPPHRPRQGSSGPSASSSSSPQASHGDQTRGPPPSFGSFFLRTGLPVLVFTASAVAIGYVLGSITTEVEVLPHYDTTLKSSKIAQTLQAQNQARFGAKQDYLACIRDLKESWKKKGKEDRVSTDAADLEVHGISEWSYHEEKRPNVVVWADSTEEVQEVVILAREWKVPVTPYAGGTSLEGHFSSPYGGISLDLSSMDEILEISEADGDVRVQAGVKWEDLNLHLKQQGVPLFFPLDPGPGATIGGMAGTGCSGTNAVRYGTAKAEWFLNLTVVLPTGEIIKTRQRARKSSAGWDTTKLFIGAEGTLGIVTEATLRLAPLLPTKVAVVTFPDVEEAVRAATEVVNSGFPVQCVEFLDARTMNAINQAGQVARKYQEEPSLFFKFQGSDKAMQEVSKGVQVITMKHGGANLEFSKSDKEADDLWQGRKAALWSVLALKDGYRCWTTDVCVPISKLPRLIKETSEDFERRGIFACHLGHVGDGNVHSLALFKTPEELAVVREGVHEMVHRAIRLDGTCTGEHGVGVGKVEYLIDELGLGTVNLMETVKRSIDPLGIMNPGKVYPGLQPIVPKS